MGLHVEITALGTLTALIISILLILKRVVPPYAMMAGALIGGLIGGLSFPDTVTVMLEGAKGMTGVVIRVLAAGVLAGVLIESGAARSIAESILHKLGDKKALLAIAGATMILTGVGVFIGVAVLTVAPIALAIAKKANLSKLGVLLAISGGGKAGNIISPNPNTIAAAESFQVSLTSVMMAGLLPATFGLIVTYLLANKVKNLGSTVQDKDIQTTTNQEMPSLWKSLSGPLVAIFLLLLQPIAGISIDPLIALPLGGLAGAIIMGKTKYMNQYTYSGLSKMADISILLLGTGTLSGIIAYSQMIGVIMNTIEAIGLPSYFLAPIAGISMSAATASTAAATAVAGSAFSQAILLSGTKALAGAAMVHAGATVLDHLPHGTFFHITRSSTNMEMRERFMLLPFETIIGLIIIGVSTLIFGVFW